MKRSMFLIGLLGFSWGAVGSTGRSGVVAVVDVRQKSPASAAVAVAVDTRVKDVELSDEGAIDTRTRPGSVLFFR